jgi:DNA-binding CsgD family transcriptional regulator
MVAPPGITQRQREVVALIAAGCSNEEVAQRLEISARTAKAHSDALRQKLGVPRRRQIPAVAPSRVARTRCSIHSFSPAESLQDTSRGSRVRARNSPIPINNTSCAIEEEIAPL